MNHTKFVSSSKRLSLLELAQLSDSQLAQVSSTDVFFSSIASLASASKEDITVLHSKKYLPGLKDTKAGACIIHPKYIKYAPSHLCLILNENPYKAYALIAQALYPIIDESPYISDKAYVAKTAKIASSTIIEPGVYIGEQAEIGENCILRANAYIGDGVKIGSHCLIENNASISNAIIGKSAHIYPGARIGQDGFGFASDEKGHYKIPHIGGVVIGDNVEIGANTCIDRGSLNDTIIEDFCRIDNLVQIGHNVKIGKGCVIVAQVGISGSVELGRFVTLAGQVGVIGQLKIGDNTTVFSKSAVMKDVLPNQRVAGIPAIPAIQWHKQHLKIKKL